MKKLLSTAILSILLTPVAAQTMTLEECMRFAVENSTAVEQKKLTADSYRQDYLGAIGAMTPKVQANAYTYNSFGRSIDPETNTYTSTSNFNNYYGISGSMPLFEGLTHINTLRAAKVARSMGATDVESARDEVALQTMQAYFDVVYYTSSVAIAEEQLAAIRTQSERIARQVELGIKSAADSAEIEAQVASNDYLLTEQQNNLASAYITLREVMNYPQTEPLEIVTEIGIASTYSGASLERVLDYARENNPKILSSAQNVGRARLNYSIARGEYLPSVYLYAGYNTQYYKNLDGTYAADPFAAQLRNNQGGYVQVSLSIPLFSGGSRLTSRRKARNNRDIAVAQHTQTVRAMEGEISQTFQQMQGFGKQYIQAQKKVAAMELAYAAVAEKYASGRVSAIELQTASNNLLSSRSELLRARLQYIIKCRMVDYYNGVPLL